MKNNHKFFENKKCRYYPCHKNLVEINCLYCFCPLFTYKFDPGCGKQRYPDGSVRECNDCIFPHQRKNYTKIIKLL